MHLLSKGYINSRTDRQFQIQGDMNLEFLTVVASMNLQYFKKVQLVKDFIIPIIGFVDISDAEEVNTLVQLKIAMDKNAKMLISGNQKIKTFVQNIEARLREVRAKFVDESEYEQFQQSIDEIKLEQIDTDSYVKFYKEEILNKIVDLVIDNDEEFNEVRKAQNLYPEEFSPVNLKSRHRLSSVSSAPSQASGIRTRGQMSRSAKQNPKLKTIQEQEEKKEVGSSMAPTNKQKLCETILEV